jgi:hypothetical protein
MKSAKSKSECVNCCNTGILRAHLKEDEEGGRHIVATVCQHYSNDMAERTLIAMHEATGLHIDVVRAEK